MSTSKKQKALIPIENMGHAAECLKTIAHPCRLRMIEMLMVEPRTVGDLAEACEIPSHMASEHLRIMKDRGLLQSERQGRYVFYYIAEEGLSGIMSCIRKRFGDAD